MATFEEKLEKLHATDAEQQKFQLENFREYVEGGIEMISGARDATTVIYLGVGSLLAFLLFFLMRRGIRRAFGHETQPLSKYQKIEDGTVMTVSIGITIICALAVLGYSLTHQG